MCVYQKTNFNLNNRSMNTHLHRTILQEYQVTVDIAIAQGVDRFISTSQPCDAGNLRTLSIRLFRNWDRLPWRSVPNHDAITAYVRKSQSLSSIHKLVTRYWPPLATYFTFGEKLRAITDPLWPRRMATGPENHANGLNSLENTGIVGWKEEKRCWVWTFDVYENVYLGAFVFGLKCGQAMRAAFQFT